jgi:hypothetical protein
MQPNLRLPCVMLLVAFMLVGLPLFASVFPSAEDIEAVRARLEASKSHWEGELKRLERIRDAVKERRDKLIDRTAEREALEKKEQEDLKEAMKKDLKALPQAFRDRFKGIFSLGTLQAILESLDKMIQGTLAGENALDLLFDQKTTQETIQKVEREIEDLNAEIAIYSAFIKGAEAKMAELEDQARAAKWEWLVRKLKEQELRNAQRSADGPRHEPLPKPQTQPTQSASQPPVQASQARPAEPHPEKSGDHDPMPHADVPHSGPSERPSPQRDPEPKATPDPVDRGHQEPVEMRSPPL